MLLACLALPSYFLRLRAGWGQDEGIFAYLPWASEQTGQPLYQAGVENKAPGIFWMYQALRAYDLPGLNRVRLLQGVLVLATAVLLWLWLRRAGLPRVGAWGALLYLALLPRLMGAAAITEVPMVLFTVAGFALLYTAARAGSARGLVASGALFAGAILFKQVAVFDLAAAVLALAVGTAWGIGLRRVGWLLLGGGAAGAAILAYFALSGGFRGLWEGTVVTLLDGSLGQGDPRGLAFARCFADGSGWVPLPLLLVAVGGAALPGNPLRRDPLLWRLLWLWLVFAVAGFLLGTNLWIHQMVAFLPALVLLAAGSLLALRGEAREPRGGRRTARLALVGLVGIAFPAAVWLTATTEDALGWLHPPPDPAAHVAAVLAQWVPPTETIYVAAQAAPIYLQARRLSPLRQFHWSLLNPPRLAGVVEGLRRTRPAAVVVGPAERPLRQRLGGEVRQWLRDAGYRRVHLAGAADLELYLRSDLGPAASGREKGEVAHVR